MKKKLAVHPGEILREDFLEEYNLTPGALAKALQIPRDRIEKIVREKRSITADTATRFARFFETSAQFWMNLQTNYDLSILDEAQFEAIEKVQAAE